MGVCMSMGVRVWIGMDVRSCVWGCCLSERVRNMPLMMFNNLIALWKKSML